LKIIADRPENSNNKFEEFLKSNAKKFEKNKNYYHEVTYLQVNSNNNK
jgi:hypothetical protein